MAVVAVVMGLSADPGKSYGGLLKDRHYAGTANVLFLLVSELVTRPGVLVLFSYLFIVFYCTCGTCFIMRL